MMMKKLLHDFCSPVTKSNKQVTVLKTLLLVVLLYIGSGMTYGQVATNYNYSESVGNSYTELTGATSLTTTFLNPVPTLVALGGADTFKFNNVSYTNLYISDNGFVTLGTATFGTNAYTPLSLADVAGNNGVIAGYGCNIHNANALAPYSSTVGGGFIIGVVYKVLTIGTTDYTLIGGVNTIGTTFTATGVGSGTGTASVVSEVTYKKITVGSDQVFVVQYKDVIRRNSITNCLGLMNFQIRLNLTTNFIEVLFKENYSSATVSTTIGQVGIRSNLADYNGRQNGAAQPTWVSSAPVYNTLPITINNASQGLKISNAINYAAGTSLVWSPCYNPTTLVFTMNGDNSSADFSWTVPVNAPTSYNYEIRTSGLPGSGGAFYSGTITSGSLPGTVIGLSTGVTYTIYVKSSCKPSWTGSLTSSVIPTCPLSTIPYFEDFEGIIAPARPNCTTTAVVAGAAMVTINNTVPVGGFGDKNLITSGALAQNTWFFSPAISVTAGDIAASSGSFRLSYRYGGTAPTKEQKMKVGIGTVASVAGMTTILVDHPSIKLSPLTNILNFTISVPGTYYLGFNGYAPSVQGFLQVDNIELKNTTCFPPTALNAPIGLVSSSSALINWTAPVTGASSGYDYYYATVASGLTPTSITTPAGSTAAGGIVATLSSLTGSTAYNFWVRSNCGSGDFSAWSTVGTFTTLAPYIPSCLPSGLGFSQDLNGITNVTMGSINNTTGLEVNNYGDYSGLVTNVAQGATVPVSITYKTGFAYDTAIWVDWNKDGDFLDPGEKVTPLVDLASTSSNPSVFLTSFVVPGATPLGSYRLRIGGKDTLFSATALTPCRTASFQAFEDYTIFVIVAPPALSLSGSTQTVCSATCTPTLVNITSTLANFQVYSWSPNDGSVTGTPATGYTFCPLVSTTYILTASQTSGTYSSNTASYIVNVNPIPTNLTITPSSLTICQSATAAEAVALVVTGGVIGGIAVPPVIPNGDVNEDFNSATTSYTFTNTSTGGVFPLLAAWTPHSSPFVGVGPSGTFIFNSNDNSQFYQSNSDFQRNGSSPVTNTEMISPLFDIPNTYTSATLSFWHNYKGWTSGTAEVQISIDSGVTYTTLPSASWSTITQGSESSFVKVSLDLAGYIANVGATLKIKFKYSNANFGWYWSVDNVSVTGSTSSTVTWTSTAGVAPNTGLFTDLIGTPYNGLATSATVYAKPNTTTTFTATASTFAPVCPTNQTIIVTVTPLVAGAASSDQSLCFGLPAALFVTSGSPVGSATPVRWEYATDFAFTVPIAIATSASSTLSVAKMTTPALTAPRFFRAVFTNGVCTAYSNVVTINFKTTTWNGSAWSNGVPDATKGAIFSGNYSSTGDLTACSVKVNSNVTVTFNNCNNITAIADPTFLSSAGHTLTVENTVAVSTVSPIGNIIFQNHASLMQGLTNTTNGNTGAITYNRRTQPITKFDYTYWSSPVANQVLSVVSPLTLSGRYYYFDPVFYVWTDISNLTAMQNGQGYIIRGPQSWTTAQIWTAPFNGVPNNGDITPIISGGNSVLYTDPTHKSNCLGNPYPSALNADLFMAGNPEFSGGTTMYFWTHNNAQVGGQYVAADYATYNYTGPTGVGMAAPGSNNRAPNGRIASGQAFMIRANTTGTVTFTNAMRNITPTANNISNNNFYRTSNQEVPLTVMERNRVWIDLRNDESAFKQLMVGYIQNATNGYDNGYDGDIIESENPIRFYSILDASKLTIQGRALPFKDTDQIPLGYSCDVATNYEIALSQFDGLFTDTSVGIYLDDTLLNATHNLRESSYTFVTEAGTFDTRFVLRYTTALSVNQNALTENQVLVYKQNNDIRIQSKNSNLKSVLIYDTRGRLILDKQNINSESVVFENIEVAKEVLLVQVTRQDRTVVTKKVIF